MLPPAPRKMLYLNEGLQSGYVTPSPAIVNYLGLEDGSTETLLYAAVKDQRCIPMDEPTLNKVIEVTHSVLLHGDFKVAQLPVTGNILVKCSSAEDANLLHQKVKVCDNLVIGFRKLLYVHIDPQPGHIAELIRDAMPHEFKLQKTREDYVREMKKLLGQDYDEVGGSSGDAAPAAEVEVVPGTEVQASSVVEVDVVSSSDAEGEVPPSEAGGSKDGAEGVSSKKRKI